MPDLLIGAASLAMGPRTVPGTIAPGMDANARLMLHRSVVLTADHNGVLSLDHKAISTWAVTTNLGQGPDAGRTRPKKTADHAAALLTAVARRRDQAVATLARRARGDAAGVAVHPVELEARGALITGTGESGIRDVGIALDGTYGWPMLRASSLKGVARDYARQIELPEPEIDDIFGAEPQASDGVPGSVTFFDALPGADGVEVTAHVLTPHTRGYRSAADRSTGPATPHESINPVPIPFLAIERGRFRTYLVGPEPQVSRARDLLSRAVADLGLGAKTAAGYGYLTATVSAAATRPVPAPATSESAEPPGAETAVGQRRTPEARHGAEPKKGRHRRNRR